MKSILALAALVLVSLSARAETFTIAHQCSPTDVVQHGTLEIASSATGWMQDLRPQWQGSDVCSGTLRSPIRLVVAGNVFEGEIHYGSAITENTNEGCQRVTSWDFLQPRPFRGEVTSRVTGYAMDVAIELSTSSPKVFEKGTFHVDGMMCSFRLVR